MPEDLKIEEAKCNNINSGIRIYTPLIIFLATFIIYYTTSGLSTQQDYFVRLADTFIHGHLYLTENPSWLSELVPMNGKYYVIYPPMPAIIIVPFVILKGLTFDQTLASIFVGSLNSVLVYMLIKKIFPDDSKRTESLALWITIMFTFGTVHWFLASVGSAWYYAHVTGVFFLFLALNEVFGNKIPWLVGIFLGAAYWSRLPIILSIPFFLWMIPDKWSKCFRENVRLLITDYRSSIFQFFIGLGIFVCFNFIYNYLRFGTIFDVAYYLQPGLSSDPVCGKRLFGLNYIPDHLETFLLKGPLFISTFPYVQPSWVGMAIWITTPAFIFALKSYKDKITLACWSAIIPIAVLVMSHCGTGITQFGYRFAMDFYPFLIILTARGMNISTNLKWYHKLLIVIGIIVNLWGVIWINKFGWVGW